MARKKRTRSPQEAARALRADARYAEVFNSGLEVWLYDAAHRDRLRASGAFETEVDAAEFETRMAGLVREGLIMAYQLMQDDSLSVAVAVGEPLSAKEREASRWLEPQAAFLRIPSGKLVIESNDALTIRSDPPSDKGAELSVPAGDYLATLYRIDHDALEADGIDWTGPDEFIVLTPGAEAKPLARQPALLPWVPRGPGEAAWKVTPGFYEGAALVQDADSTIAVALDPAGGKQLGLADLAVLRLTVPALGIELVLLYLEGDANDFEFFARVEKVRPPRELAGGEWAPCWFQPSVDRLFGMRQNARARVAKKLQESWHPATLRLLEGRGLERKRG